MGKNFHKENKNEDAISDLPSSHKHEKKYSVSSRSSNSRRSTINLHRCLLSGYIDFTDEELSSVIEKCIYETNICSIENEILEKYIMRVNPKILAGMNQQIEAASAAAMRVEKMIGAFLSNTTSPLSILQSDRKLSIAISEKSSPTNYSLTSPRHLSKGSIYRSSNSLKQGTSSNLKYELTTSILMEIAMSVLEEMRVCAEQYSTGYRIRKNNLNAEIEQQQISLNEIIMSKEMLEQNVVEGTTAWVGTQIAAEKLMRHIKDLLKSNDQKIGKMRLNISRIRAQLKRIKLQLKEKIYLGESIMPTDFEELRIENKECAVQLEAKIQFITHLKKITGMCHNNLFTHKRNLDELLLRLNVIQTEIAEKNEISRKLKKEKDEVFKEFLKAQHQYELIKKLTTEYRGPKVVDYIRRKAYLREIENSVKILKRRISIQETTVNLLRNKLKVTSPEEFDNQDIEIL